MKKNLLKFQNLQEKLNIRNSGLTHQLSKGQASRGNPIQKIKEKERKSDPIKQKEETKVQQLELSRMTFNENPFSEEKPPSIMREGASKQQV